MSPRISLSSASLSGSAKSRASLAAASASRMMASITGWKWRGAENTGAEMASLGAFLSLGFDHQDRIGGAGDHEVELTLLHLVDLRVEHELVIDEADARRSDRSHERHAGQGQRGGSRDHGEDVGIIFQVVRQHGDD